MKLYYISPSVIPSRTANSIHTVHQCNAFQNFESIKITFFAVRSILDSTVLNKNIEFFYGVKLNKIRLTTFYNRLPFGNNIFLCFFSLFYFLKEKLPDVIISRNLYASFIISVLLNQKLFYETHEIEQGIYRLLQKSIVAQPNVTTIVISEKLKRFMLRHHNVQAANIFVLHDAAPEGLSPLTYGEKKDTLRKFVPDEQLDGYNLICGYFGHLYSGRGIEIIYELAKSNNKHAFLIIGGNDSDILAMKIKYSLNNLIFLGFVPHSISQKLMSACDVLLMPYQKHVSIGSIKRDTSRWMSPMKMFEYLGSGTPIISSDLPVLREVLNNNINAILVPSKDINQWDLAIKQIYEKKEFARNLGIQGHNDYLKHYTWSKRAEKYLNIVNRN